jgi:carbon monoxide dehydrogenase subunit G
LRPDAKTCYNGRIRPIEEAAMHLQGTVTINAPRSRVWEYLTDPHQVSQCAPGVEKVEIVEEGKKFRAIAAIGFGTVKARFAGDVEWLELDAPNRAKMKGHGNASGSAADVISEMKLSDAPTGGTQLDWTADVTVVGQLASLAARLMGTVSQKLTSAFFECIRKKIEGPPPATETSGPPAESASQPAEGNGQPAASAT